MVDSLSRDVRYAMLVVRRQPASSVAAILTIAVAVGLNTAIFSVANAVLLRPLPYTDPDRLVACGKGDPTEARLRGLSEPEYYDWLERNRVFQGMAASHSEDLDLVVGRLSEPLQVERISASLLPLLDVKPLVGRAFVPNDEGLGHDKVAILSEGLWRRLFDADPGVIGKRVRLQSSERQESYEVVGVTPHSFRFRYPTTPQALRAKTATGVDVFLPLALRRANATRKTFSYSVYARLKAGVSVEQARAASVALQQQLKRDYPDTIQDYTAIVTPLHEATFGSTRRAVLMLVIAVGLVLLIGCTNVANLLLARGTRRGQEMAIRAALGAGRLQIFRQMLAESMLLSLLGGTLGLLLAAWLTRVAEIIMPSAFARGNDIPIDASVLAFTAGCSLIAGVLFGLPPAWRASQQGVVETLKVSGAGTADRSGRRFQHALVGTQCALVVMLCCGAGVMVNSFSRIVNTDLGFDIDHVVTMLLRVPSDMGRQFGRRVTFDERLLATVRRLPGVVRASITSELPFSTGGMRGFTLPGQPLPHWAEVYCVEPTYPSLIGLSVIRGRSLSPGDQEGRRVAIINQAAADKYFAGVDPLGQALTLKDDYEIVGVVSNHREMQGANGVRAARLRDAAYDRDIGTSTPAAVYVPSAQAPWEAFMFYLIVRTDHDQPSLVGAIRRAVAQIEPEVAVKEVATTEDWQAVASAGPRFYATVLTVFSAVALLLASIGMYGVLSQAVGRRTREIGIRMALGATAGRVAVTVLSQTAAIVAVGLIAGFVGANVATSLLRSFLFEVAPNDPPTFAVVCLVLVLACCAAAWFPMRRATRIDPIHALRCE